ncbi:MAG TPA: CotH kinase family protein [Verrucomicrobiae bacterium]
MIRQQFSLRHSQAVLVAGLVFQLAARERLSPSGSVAQPPAAAAPGADLFVLGPVRQIRIVIPPAGVAALRQDSRGYVRATVTEAGQVYESVGLHLKGSTGSFRSLDDKPGLTLSFARFNSGQRFHGLRKIHLNNSVEDDSYLNEWIGGELFRAAGVPAPRVSWALVQLNGRKLGLYVLKEGFTEDFLGLHFTRTNGNLYDAGAGHDVTDEMERDSGDGPEDRADLKALVGAALERDLTNRWQRLERILDLDRFLSFMATEVIIGHRDGYCLAHNNYRIYHDPERDRIIFLPHGMDNLFGRPDAPWRPHLAGLVARAVIETPEGGRRYRERIGLLLTNAFKVQALTDHVNQLVSQIRSALDSAAARDFAREAIAVKERMAHRRTELERQLSAPELLPLQFEHEVARLSGWRAVDEPAPGRMEQGKAADGRAALVIHARGDTSASWRCKVLLGRGRYRFEGKVAIAGVKPLAAGKNNGAGLRLSGHKPPQPYDLVGDSAGEQLQYEFEVDLPTEEVELVCELRARAGDAWFDLDSLRLVRRK